MKKWPAKVPDCAHWAGREKSGSSRFLAGLGNPVPLEVALVDRLGKADELQCASEGPNGLDRVLTLTIQSSCSFLLLAMNLRSPLT